MMPVRLSATPASFLGGMASLKIRHPPARMMTVFRWPTCADAWPDSTLGTTIHMLADPDELGCKIVPMGWHRHACSVSGS